MSSAEQFFAAANASTRSAGAISKETTLSGRPGPTANFSIYTSGACSIEPRGPMAITVNALGMSLAVSVVPSNGSNAISTAGPLPVPTSSPIKSMGASSRSPSPMTTTPAMSNIFNCVRMALTAAWSAAFSSPRPMSLTEARAACSATRASPSDRARS